MIVQPGEKLFGPAGSATELKVTLFPTDPPDWKAHVAAWFLDCPGQSPAWRHYALNVIHLRLILGAPPANIELPHATHELMVMALDPVTHPVPERPQDWRRLTPLNVVEQFQVPSDDDATQIAKLCVTGILQGVLPAEPALAGAREPWRTSIIRTSAHFRGEEHAT